MKNKMQQNKKLGYRSENESRKERGNTAEKPDKRAKTCKRYQTENARMLCITQKSRAKTKDSVTS